jgi:hypothetical protein
VKTHGPRPTPDVDIQCQLLFVQVGEEQIVVDIVALDEFQDGCDAVAPGTPVTLFLSPERGRARAFRELVATLERWADSTVLFRFVAVQLALGRHRYELWRGEEHIVLEVGR